MFSEVYWHHTVRSATAMIQRAFYLVHTMLDLDSLFRMTEPTLIGELERTGAGGPAGELLEGLFGALAAALQTAGAIQLFSRNADCTSSWRGGPYPWLANCADQFAAVASTALDGALRRTKCCSIHRR